MELSENLKPRLDQSAGESQHDRPIRLSDLGSGNDSGQNDDAESQMRKALGLLGESSRLRLDPERIDQPNRMGDRFNGGLHRRRFVQDGDIPVTVLRRDQGHEAPAHRGVAPAVAPSSSRLQRTESALAAETAAREKAERVLVETQVIVRDLQTKIGHAELAKTESVEGLLRERALLSQLQADAMAWDERLREASARARSAEQAAESYQEQLGHERNARKAAEKALRGVEAALETAEQLVRTLSEATPAARRVEPSRSARPEPEIIVAASRRQRMTDVPAAEPEPVKWWLNTKPATKRR